MRSNLAERADPSPATVPTADDAALARRLGAGDQQAFRIVVDRHLPFLLAITRRMLGSDGDAEDVAQEALIRLWRNAEALDLGPGGFRPWLRRVVSNLCIDRIRSRGPTTLVAEPPEQAMPPDQMAGLDADHLGRRIDAALQRLPERQRLALTLFHFEGASQAEVAAALGVSEDAVESLLARARRGLKTDLAHEWRDLIPEDRT